MTSATVRRLKRELNEITRDPPSLCSASLINDDIFNWIATIKGPPGSPYEGGIFKLELGFDNGYPFRPPRADLVKNEDLSDLFSTVSGPNSIQEDFDKWKIKVPNCNPHSPLNRVIAHLYLNNRELHDINARNYTKKYAVP